MGVNKAILVGNVGTDVEFRSLPSGTNLAKFRMATTDNRFKDENGNPRTEWHNVVAWGKLAELCDRYVRKGRLLYVEGSIRTHSYEKDGQRKFFTEINADNVQFLGSRDQDEGRGGGYGGPPASDGYGGPPQDDGFSSGGSSGGGGYGSGDGGGSGFPDDGDDVPF